MPLDKKPRTTEHTSISLQLDEKHASQQAAPLDDVDLAEVSCKIRRVVEQLRKLFTFYFSISFLREYNW